MGHVNVRGSRTARRLQRACEGYAWMNMNIMTTPKLKLELTPGSLETFKTIPLIRALKTRPQRSSEVSVFFDTGKLKLR